MSVYTTGMAAKDAPAAHIAAPRETAPGASPAVEIEPFAEYAWRELLACPMGEPGHCAHPDCQRPFAAARDWQRYCSASCRAADERETRRIGHKAAPALLAWRMGKYTETGAPDAAARRALSAAARRYLGRLQSDWLRDREARAERARMRWTS